MREVAYAEARYHRPMSAEQIYFGALAWPSRDALERALASSLLSSPEHVRHEVEAARRGESALMFTLSGSMRSSWFHELGGAIHRLAESAARGRVAIVYSGDGDEFSLALARGADKCVLPPGALPTQRWLVLNEGNVSVAWLGQPTPLEFEVFRREGTHALDVRDWLGGGVLFEYDETLFLETAPGKLYEWAQPDKQASVAVIAEPHAEFVTLVEVRGAQPVVGTSRTDTVELLLHSLFVSSSAAHYLEKPPRVLHRETSVWLARGEGIVAIRGI